MATYVGFPTLVISTWSEPDGTTEVAGYGTYKSEFDPSKQLGLLAKQSDRMNRLGLCILLAIPAVIIGCVYYVLHSH